MKPGNIPETYVDVFTLAKAAQSVSYYRALGCDASAATLDLQLDDYASDRRTCVSVRMGSGKAGRIEVKTLCGYSREKHAWREYCDPAASLDLPDRRGQKALIAWCAEQSQALTGWPGSTSWSLFRPAPIPNTSALMSRALVY